MTGRQKRETLPIGDDSSEKPSRMSPEEEEIFIQLCVSRYDIINPKATVRGLPTSAGPMAIRKEQITEEWDDIAAQMADITNVRIFSLGNCELY